MINRVKLKNWRSHLESDLLFSTGTNALLGHLGAGKTSVLDSICFCLFGTFPNLNSKKLKLDDLIMKKPSEKDRAEVEVSFVLDGKSYSVKRIIEKGKGTTHSEIRENGNLIESPSSQRVTEVVEKILKINYDLFSKAIYSEQNSLDIFLTIPKGQRMKKIDELLMIDKFEKARLNTVTLVNKFSERKFAFKKIVDSLNISDISKSVTEINESINSILNEKDKISEEYSVVSSDKEKVEAEVKRLEKLNLELNDLSSKGASTKRLIEEISSSILDIEKDIGSYSQEDVKNEIEVLENDLKNLELQIEEKKKSLEILNKSLAESKARINILKNEKIQSLEKQWNEKLRIKFESENIRKKFNRDLSLELEEKRQVYENLLSEFHVVKTRIEELTSIIEHLSSTEGSCPVCDSRLTPERKLLLFNQKKRQIDQYNKELEKIVKNKEMSENEVKTLEETSKSLDEMLNNIKDLDSVQLELSESKKIYLSLSDVTIKTDNDLSKIKREFEDFNRDFKEKQKKKQAFEMLSIKFSEYNHKKNRLEELIEEKLDVESDIEKIKLSFFEINLSDLQERFKYLIGREKELEIKIKSVDQIVQEKQIRLKDLEKKIEEYNKSIGELEKIEKIVNDLKIFQLALEETQIELRREFVDAVNFTMNNLWNTLYPYRDFIGVRLNVEEGDYILQLQEKYGNWINVEGIVSGGERSLAALALRIAFALVLAPQLRMLILDEPTANLDSRAISELSTTLRERIGEYIDQTFLITHQSELEDAVTGNAYRFEREKEREGPTKTIQLI